LCNTPDTATRRHFWLFASSKKSVKQVYKMCSCISQRTARGELTRHQSNSAAEPRARRGAPGWWGGSLRGNQAGFTGPHCERKDAGPRLQLSAGLACLARFLRRRGANLFRPHAQGSRHQGSCAKARKISLAFRIRSSAGVPSRTRGVRIRSFIVSIAVWVLCARGCGGASLPVSPESGRRSRVSPDGSQHPPAGEKERSALATACGECGGRGAGGCACGAAISLFSERCKRVAGSLTQANTERPLRFRAMQAQSSSRTVLGNEE
jgi:hypothetical protein